MKYLIRIFSVIILISLVVIIPLGCLKKDASHNLYLSLKNNFLDPPREARPKALWTWLNGNVELSSLTNEMKEAKEKGLGGFDIWDVGMLVDPDSIVPKGPPFMSESSVNAIAHALKEAERFDMEMGLTISSSWNAGGSWVQEEHGVMGLFRSSIQVKGGKEQRINIPKPFMEREMNLGIYEPEPRMLKFNSEGLPEYRKDVALIAFPLRGDSTFSLNEIVDLTQHINDSTILWEFPEGTWQITRYTCMPTGQAIMLPSANSRGLMIDHFSAEAMEMHLNYFFDCLIPEIGDLGESPLMYFYNDSYEANSSAWTPKMPEEFLHYRGYDIKQYLPVLDGFTVENREVTDRFAYDYRKTLSDMIINNHYVYGRKLCNEKGIGYVAEAGGPGPPVHNVPFQDLAALGALDIPRGEFWYEHPSGEKHMNELQIIKGISSAAHIYDQLYVEAESFTSVWVWQEGPKDLKPVADKAFCEGLNRIVYHTFPHIPEAAGHPGWIYNFGTVMNTHRAWWPKSRAWNDYLARVSYMMQQGNFVADIAYYYGNEAPLFVGHKRIFPWLGEGYDYDVINTEILLDKIDVVDGRLMLPHGQSYSILVLPDDERMDLDVLKRIRVLVEKGATVVGPKPEKVYGLFKHDEQEEELSRIVSELWGACDSVNIQENVFGKGKIVWGKTPRTVLMESGKVPDFSYTADESIKLEYIHRATDDLDIYFIRNADSLSNPVEINFRSTGAPELWDPDNGETYFIPIYKSDEGTTSIPLEFAPYESYIIVFRKGINKKHISRISDSGMPVFPGGNAPGLLVDKDGGLSLSFSEQGIYDIEYSDGVKEQFKATAGLAQKLDGPWEVSFSQEWDAPENVVFNELIAWNKHEDPGIQVYSGIASYKTTFTFSASENDNMVLTLDLGTVFEVADVTLNGVDLGIRSYIPFTYMVTEKLKEENELVIEVANLLNNQLVGEGRKPTEVRKTRSNVNRLPSPWSVPMGEAQLLESGLIGPVTIEIQKLYKPNL